MCDEPAVAALLERIYRDYGRLDGVIHGAGIIEDRLIEDKDESSFDRVFDTKVDSSFILARHVKPDTLRFLVFYASVSGRIGNRGQADYAAANEVLNRLAWQLDRQWPNTRVVAINWGPWDSNGMASAQVLRELRSRGIVPVQAQSGRSFLMEELKKGRKGDVEIIAGDGPWPSFENSQVPVQSPPASNCRAQLPFVRNAPAIASGGAVAMEHTFSVAADPYLEDHLLDSAPVLPLAAVLEWVAEFVQSAWPEWTVVSVRDLRVLKGIVVGDREQIKAEFRAKSSTHSNGDSLNVGIEVVDVERKVVCYRATAVLQTCEIRDAGGRVTPLPPARRLDAGTAYRDYLFHGDRFRLLTAITSITDAGIDAAAIPSDAAAWLNPGAKRSNVEGPIGHWLFDPGIVDVAPQLAIVWSRMKYGMTAIPNRFGTATRFGKGPMTGPMNVALRVRPSSDPCNLIYDATFFAADGSVRLFLEECNSACSERLNKIAIPAQ